MALNRSPLGNKKGAVLFCKLKYCELQIVSLP